MRKEQAQLGEHYIAKISGTLTVVRLDKEHRSGGWVATNKATGKPVRIRTAGKLRRKALPGEFRDSFDKDIATADGPAIERKSKPAKATPKPAKTDPKSDKAKAETNKAAAKPDKAETKDAKKPEGKPEGKYLTSVYAHKVFQANRGKYQGILILETGAYHLAFGLDATCVAKVLRRKRDLSKQSFGRGRKRAELPVFSIPGKEVEKTMVELANRGHNVFHATQKIIDGKRVEDYEITRQIQAGQSKTTGRKPFNWNPGDPVPTKTQPGNSQPAKRGRKAKKRELQKITIAVGATFRVRSGNPYQIRMIGKKVVYAQQLRDDKPCGPTRPFDRASLETGDPHGTRGEDSYYPKSEALEAAAKVLAKAKNPMAAKDIMQEILRQKLWFTTGKTPHVTLASALSRDIKKHGKKSRFKRADRGLFELS
ncbi:MAG: winged helix-turn-helix domain-containing protein [Phycisphaerae bacterium]|nr:winged helix-turn-helix domain-containing protein [Phycisphaerae bacterium]